MRFSGLPESKNLQDRTQYNRATNSMLYGMGDFGLSPDDIVQMKKNGWSAQDMYMLKQAKIDRQDSDGVNTQMPSYPSDLGLSDQELQLMKQRKWTLNDVLMIRQLQHEYNLQKGTRAIDNIDLQLAPTRRK